MTDRSTAPCPPSLITTGNVAVTRGDQTTTHDGGGGHLQCPFCQAYEVDRLFLASLRLDSCACLACGARWDEDPVTGEYRGRASRSTVATPRER